MAAQPLIQKVAMTAEKGCGYLFVRMHLALNG